MSHNHISDLERGARNPSIYTLCRLTEPLGITLSEFFNENDEAVFLSETERDLIHNFRKLPIVQSEKLFELIKVMADEN